MVFAPPLQGNLHPLVPKNGVIIYIWQNQYNPDRKKISPGEKKTSPGLYFIDRILCHIAVALLNANWLFQVTLYPSVDIL